jgi:hypothetical protein
MPRGTLRRRERRQSIEHRIPSLFQSRRLAKYVRDSAGREARLGAKERWLSG